MSDAVMAWWADHDDTGWDPQRAARPGHDGGPSDFNLFHPLLHLDDRDMLQAVAAKARADLAGLAAAGAFPPEPPTAVKEWRIGQVKYSDDQARDERGRFTSGGGGTATATKPSPPPLDPDDPGVSKAMAYVQGMNISNSRPLDHSRLGRCYELSAEKAVDLGARLGQDPDPHSPMTLVHGTIQGFGHPPIGHGWVLSADGSEAWEPATNQWYPKAAFDAYYNAVPEHTYSAEEAAINMVKSGHYGPWE